MRKIIFLSFLILLGIILSNPYAQRSEAQTQTINATLPNFWGPYDASAPWPPLLTVGTFSYQIPMNYDIVSAMISGTWGCDDPYHSTAGVDVYLEGLFVAQCVKPGQCWVNKPNGPDLPWSNNLPSSLFPQLVDGSALLTSQQTSEYAVHLCALSLTITVSPRTCSIFSIVPQSWNHGAGAETGTVSVQTNTSNCQWVATSNTPTWIIITSGGSGTGNGTVNYSVSANPGPTSRTGTMTIAGQTFTVTQAAPTPICTYTLSVNINPLSGGTVTKNPQQSTYCAGDQVTLTAIPNSGYTFSSWSGAASGSTNPISITMNGNQTVTANFITQSPCNYIIISPTAQNFGSGGGTGYVGVTAGSGCPWTATSNDPSWITITSGTSGTGTGIVNYSVSANPGPNSRTGTMTIAEQTFTVTQAPPTATCTYTISPTAQNFGSGINSTVVSVTATSNCQWTATSNDPSWITITSGSSGTGNGTVYYTVSANPGPNSRTGTMTIAGQTFTVTQAAPTSTCTYTLSVTTNPSSGGTITITPQKSTYCAGDQVTLTATPNPGYTFSSWNGVDSSNGPTAMVTMNGNRTVTVNFNINPSACNYLISSSGVNHGPGQEAGSVAVTAGAGCSWTATSNASWITITSGNGSGNGTVTYSVSANIPTPPKDRTDARTGILTIAGLTFTVTQIGSIPEGFTISPPALSPSPDWKLYGVHFPSFDSGWAVGHDAVNSRGVLLKFTAPCQEGCDGNWNTVTPPTVSSNWDLVGVHFTSPDEGWAVGQDLGNSASDSLGASATATTGRGLLLHYLNSSWSLAAPPDVSSAWSIEGVHFASPIEGWAVGSDSVTKRGVLLHYSQGSWTSVAPPDVSSQWELYGIYLLSSNEGWAVGSDMSNNRGVLLHYLNGSWSAPPAPSVSSSWYLGGVHFSSSNEGWAVGRDNTNKSGVLLHYFNGFWTSVTPPYVSPDWDLYSVHFVSSSQGWASGNDAANNRGVFLRYSKGSWLSVPPPNVNSSWSTTGVRCRCSESWSVGNDATNKRGLTIQHTDASLGEKPNLVPYRPKGWSDKIVVSSVKGTNLDRSILYNTQNLYVGFAVTNDSQMPIRSNFHVDLYVDGVSKGSWDWDPLNGCHYRYLKDYPIGSLSVGTHSIKIKVDSTGLIDESDEGDNEYEKTITVVSSDKPNVVFLQQQGWSGKMIVSKKRGVESSYPLTTKDTIYVSWCIQNNGGAKTPGKVTVRLYVDGVQTKSWQSTRSMTPSSKWVKTNQSIGKKLSAQEHEIKLVIDAGNLTPANEGDSEVMKNINVQGTAGEVTPPRLDGLTYLGVDQATVYVLRGSVCSKGGDVEYYLDWGDGSPPEDWFPTQPIKIKTHYWSEGYYEVSGKARCKDYPDIQSEWVSITVTVATSSGGDGDD